MTRKPQKLLTTVILLTLFASIACTAIPNAYAAELTSQQKALSTLNNVVDLDTSKYDITTTQNPNDLYKDNLPRENIRTILDASGSKIDALCTFINGSLQKIYVCNKEGPPHMKTAATSDAAMAQNFLANYQTQKTLYEEFNSILSKTDGTKNSSITIGNIKLTVLALEKDTTFRWTYVTNGIEAPDKCVVLRYTNGFLNCFIDNWNLHEIGSTSFNLSEEEAITIAINTAKNYSSKTDEKGTIGGIKFNVTNAMIYETLLASSVYAGADKARSQDPLELYPMHHVWVSLDKFYPGNVYGFNVYVWADTKEVYYVHKRVSTIEPPEELVASAPEDTQPSDYQTANSSTVLASNNLLSIVLIILVVCITILFMLMPAYLSAKKKMPFSLLSLPKTRFFKVSCVLLCFLTLSSLLLVLCATWLKVTNLATKSSWKWVIL